jgi:hypothetical protein
LSDIYVNYPFLSLLLSISLIVGVYEIGNYVLKIRNLEKIFSSISDLNYQKLFLGGNLLLFFLYPLVLYLESRFILVVVGSILLILGLKKILLLFYQINNYTFPKTYKLNNFSLKKIDYWLFVFIFILLFFISASPVTNADALDYHMTVGKHIAIHGKFPLDLTHFHARLAGSGEIIIALGLIFGAEQFGSIFQLAGFASLIGIFLKKQNSFFLTLLLISSPVVLYLISGPKPQLFNICSIGLIFYIFILDKNKYENSTNKIKIILGLATLMVATQVKFSFNLSAALLSVAIFYFSVKNHELKIFIMSTIVLFFIIIFPPILWKYINYGGNIFLHIFYPVPINLAGMTNFNGYLTNTGSEKGLFNIFFPRSKGEIANSLGIGIVFFFYLIFKDIKKNISSIALIVLFVITSLMAGQINARFFYEPFMWTILTFANYNNSKNLNIFIKYFFRIYFLIFLIISMYGAFFLFPGVVNKTLRDKMMLSNASGYALFQWVNKELPKNSAIMSYHRSIFLSTHRVISVDLLSYSVNINRDYIRDRNKTALLYWKEIQKIKPEYLVTYGYDSSQNLMNIKNCLGSLYKKKKDLGHLEYRNPFNRSSQKYNGYIYKLNYKNIPECLYDESKKIK